MKIQVQKAPFLILSLFTLAFMLNSCKKNKIEEQAPSPKTVKAIKVANHQSEQNYIVNYNQNKQVSYVGSADLRNGYSYSYQGTKVNQIIHTSGDLQYTLTLNYADHVLIDGVYTIKNAKNVVTSFPLTPVKNGDVTIIATNSNDLIYLELHVQNGNLIRAYTNSAVIKTSINFQYNEQKHSFYGNTIPLFQLKNPFSQATAVLVNELVSLALQAISQKQLTTFQSVYATATLNYTHNAGDISTITCKGVELDADGNLKAEMKTDITYLY